MRYRRTLHGFNCCSLSTVERLPLGKHDLSKHKKIYSLAKNERELFNQKYFKPVTQVNTKDGKLLICQDQLRCGLAADNDWVISIPESSRHLFIITKSADAFFLEDLNSANGTIVGKKVLHNETIHLKEQVEVRVAHDTKPYTLSPINFRSRISSTLSTCISRSVNHLALLS